MQPILLFALLTLNSTPLPHPIHLSMTQIYWDEKEDALALSINVFIDDFREAIGYAKNSKAIEQGRLTIDQLMLTYLEKNLIIKVNGRSIPYTIGNKETYFPALTCYLIPDQPIQNIESIEVTNKVLLELFDDQKNLVQIKIKGKNKLIELNRKRFSKYENF